MKLFEYEGKKLFRKYGLPVLPGFVFDHPLPKASLKFPLILKAQVLSGDRKAAGGIVVVKNDDEFSRTSSSLFLKTIQGEPVKRILAEQFVEIVAEYYVSFSYDGKRRAPVLAVSAAGGSGINTAHIFGIDVLGGLTADTIGQELAEAKFPQEDVSPVSDIILKLWRLFNDENVIVAEINPILKTTDGKFFAGDAKVDSGKRREVEKLGGDIAVIASGGGASLINIDSLILAGGRPANYCEYSGNPPKEVVTKLTKEVLSDLGLKGCWVVGGTANFTDIYETMLGFVEGISELKTKPNFSFVIRRGGPRQAEAAAMLKEFAAKHDLTFYVYGSETPMAATAKYIVDVSYRGLKPPSV